MQRHTQNPVNNLNRPIYKAPDLYDPSIMEDVEVYGDEEQADHALSLIVADGFKRLGLKVRSIFIPKPKPRF